MTSQPNDPELEAILEEYSIRYQAATNSGLPGVQRRATTDALAAIERLIANREQTLSKAYGGCKLCYGKGYATWRHGEAHRGITSNMRNDIKSCSCSRGEELAEIVAKYRVDQFDYKRLKLLETDGMKDYRRMREAPPMTPEAVVTFINQLSPWNLKTTGLSALEAYSAKRETAAILSFWSKEEAKTLAHLKEVLDYATLTNQSPSTPDSVDRFEVIDDTGRAYVKGSIYGSPVSIELSYQDDGHTLKVFVTNQSPTEEA